MNLDSKDYDHVKNLTLLFFLDRLMDKGEPRTLHDLSCQFGTRGFTKEMRQIAGNSQSGLRKFMEQFPSLFTLNGDYVTVTNYSSGVHNPTDPAAKLVGKRDYAQEAVEYFVTKLRQYGPGTEVPIKSLLGHRSQASPEVRHVSGQHGKEFREFLMQFPDVFVFKDENAIILKEYENAEPQPFRELEQPQIDPRLTHQMIQYCAAALMQGSLYIDVLFNGLASACPPEIWQQICRNTNDLCTFLKMHGKYFSVQKNIVRLLQSPQYLMDGSNNFMNNSNQMPPLIPASQSNSPSPSPRTFQTSSSQPNSLSGSLPPIGDSTPGQPMLLRQRSALALRKAVQAKESVGIHSPSPPPPSEEDSMGNCNSIQTLKEKQKNSSLKARLSTILKKAISDNERDRSSGGTAALLPTPAIIDPTRMSPDQCNQQLLKMVEVVTTVRRCRQISNHILATRKPISLDGEGVNLGPNGPMTLLQLGLDTGQIYIFDLHIEKALMSQGGLKQVLESSEVIKVTHDCRGDAGALHFQFGVTLTNVFDTQAAYSILQMQETGKPVFKVKFTSLNHLCQSFDAPVNPKKDLMKKIYRRDQKYWARRPLTHEMILYAAYDVVALVPTLYNDMSRKMDRNLIDLFVELCEEQVYWTIFPPEVKETKRRRKMETEIEELKNRLASSNKSVVLSNREIRLLRYLELSDEEREKLEGSSKVVRKLERLQNKDRDYSPDKDDYYEDEGEEYPSISSLGSGGSSGGSGGVTSPRSDSLPPTSLTHSMHRVDEVLSNGFMDRVEKIDRLEAILTAATSQVNADSDLTVPVSDATATSQCCHCNCHSTSLISSPLLSSTSPSSLSTSTSSSPRHNGGADRSVSDSHCQTVSTGDIVITNVYFPDCDASVCEEEQ